MVQLQKFATGGATVHNRGMSESYKKPDYEQELRQAGVRITRPRRIILNILTETEDHPDALEIFRRAVEIDSSISLSTVYRTMKLLEERGAIHRHAFAGGPSRSNRQAARIMITSSIWIPAMWWNSAPTRSKNCRKRSPDRSVTRLCITGWNFIAKKYETDGTKFLLRR